LNKQEILFIQDMFQKQFDEDLPFKTLNTLLEHENKIILRKLTHLGNLGNKRLTKFIIKLFYQNKILGQIAVLISLGNFELSKFIIKILYKDLNTPEETLIEIIKGALKNCVYIQDIFEPQTRKKLENIWMALRHMPERKGNQIAKKIYKLFYDDDRTNNILKKVIFEAFENVF
jgi:hypothetical protein